MNTSTKAFTRTVLGLLVASLLFVSPPWASAVPDDPWEAILAGAQPGDQIKFKYENLESSPILPGQELFGVFRVTSISNQTTGVDLWTDLGSTRQLTGTFSGLMLASVTPGVSTTEFRFTDGAFTVYEGPDGSWAPTGPGDPLAAQVCGGGPCPTPWLSGNFASGIDPTKPAVTLFADLTNTTTPTGKASGYIDVVGGTVASAFESNHFATPFGARDFLLLTNFFPCNATTMFCGTGDSAGNRWRTASNDPVVGQLVPEPASMLLLGSGMAGMGLWRGIRSRRPA